MVQVVDGRVVLQGGGVWLFWWGRKEDGVVWFWWFDLLTGFKTGLSVGFGTWTGPGVDLG